MVDEAGKEVPAVETPAAETPAAGAGADSSTGAEGMVAFGKELDAVIDDQEKEAADAAKDEAGEEKEPEKKDDKGDEAAGDDKNKDVADPDVAGQGDDDDGKGKDNGKADDDAGNEPVTDELLERAVKVGMTLADARTFQNADALDRQLSLLEEKAGDDKGDKDDKGEEGEEQDDFTKLLDTIPELDPETYDPKLVEVVSALKGIAKKQQEVITGLKAEKGDQAAGAASAESAEATTWFDGRLDKLGLGDVLGEGAIDSIDPKSDHFAKRRELADKIGVLEAGYAKSGKERPSRDALFDEASQSVLGDEIHAAAERDKSGKLKDRSEQHIKRPGRVKAQSEVSVEEEIAKEIDEKYVNKD